jgi:hypothetical protein
MSDAGKDFWSNDSAWSAQAWFASANPAASPLANAVEVEVPSTM